MFALMHNLYKYVKAKTERRVCLIVLGVDNAGKTTLINSLHGETDKEVSPTFGFSSSSTTSKRLGVRGRQCSLQLFDLGGGRNIRRVWKSYLAEVHGLIFVADAADSSRFEECQRVLQETLQHEHLKDKPVLVFANKQDLPGAATAAEVAQHLGLASLKLNPYHIKACTAKTAIGSCADSRLQEGMAWLLQTVDHSFNDLDVKVQKDTAVARLEEQRKKQEREERARQAREERLRQQEQLKLQEDTGKSIPLPGAVHDDIAQAAGKIAGLTHAGSTDPGCTIPSHPPHHHVITIDNVMQQTHDSSQQEEPGSLQRGPLCEGEDAQAVRCSKTSQPNLASSITCHSPPLPPNLPSALPLFPPPVPYMVASLVSTFGQSFGRLEYSAGQEGIPHRNSRSSSSQRLITSLSRNNRVMPVEQ